MVTKDGYKRYRAVITGYDDIDGGARATGDRGGCGTADKQEAYEGSKDQRVWRAMVVFCICSRRVSYADSWM